MAIIGACSVGDCDKVPVGRGWCSMHYSRWRRTGDVAVAGNRHSRPKPRMRDGEGVQCPYCSSWYVSTKKLTIHCNRLHQELLPVGCPACPRRFLDERGKQTHMGYAHSEIIMLSRNRPEVQREWNLRTKYGIGIADYERMLASQDGGCATCGAPEAAERLGRLAVDHCHTTGAVRGLLCSRCNVSIGQARDSADLLRSMAAYLDRSAPYG